MVRLCRLLPCLARASYAARLCYFTMSLQQIQCRGKSKASESRFTVSDALLSFIDFLQPLFVIGEECYFQPKVHRP